jgi:hypothetical protein
VPVLTPGCDDSSVEYFDEAGADGDAPTGRDTGESVDRVCRLSWPVATCRSLYR